MTFQALQRQGVPSKFLLFPEENHCMTLTLTLTLNPIRTLLSMKENHWCLNPEHSLIWHQQVFEWIEQWTRPSSDAGHPDAEVPVFTGENSYHAEWKTKPRYTSRWASP